MTRFELAFKKMLTQGPIREHKKVPVRACGRSVPCEARLIFSSPPSHTIACDKQSAKTMSLFEAHSNLSAAIRRREAETTSCGSYLAESILDDYDGCRVSVECGVSPPTSAIATALVRTRGTHESPHGRTTATSGLLSCPTMAYLGTTARFRTRSFERGTRATNGSFRPTNSLATGSKFC
jgi:hypothetical protein